MENPVNSPVSPESGGSVRPSGRRALLLDVLKSHFGDLFLPNLVYLLFWMPAVAVCTVFLFMIQTSEPGEGPGGWAILCLWALCLFPCILITGPARVGVSLLARDLARGRYYGSPLSAFWSGLNGNWKQGLALSAVSGVLLLLVSFSIGVYFPFIQQGGRALVLPLLLGVSLILFWELLQPCLSNMIITYALPLASHIHNAVALTLKRPLLALGVLALRLLPAVPALAVLYCRGAGSLSGILAFLAGLLFYALIGPMLFHVFDASFANMMCEREINPLIPGSSVDIGLCTEREIGENTAAESPEH